MNVSCFHTVLHTYKTRMAVVVAVFSSAIWSSAVQSQTEILQLQAINSDGTSSQASFSLGMQIQGQEGYYDTADLTDSILISGNILVDPSARSLSGDIYVVISSGENFFMRTSDGGFVGWDGAASNLSPAQSGVNLSETIDVEIFNGVIGSPLDMNVYLAYRPDQSSLITYTPIPANFQITNSSNVAPQFYSPAPLVEAVQGLRSVTWQSRELEFEDLVRFSFGPMDSGDVVRVQESDGFLLGVANNLAALTSVDDDSLLRTMFQAVVETGGGYRLMSVKHSNYAIDWNSSTGELLLNDIRSGNLSENDSAYLVFEISEQDQSLLAVKRKIYEPQSNEYVDESNWQSRAVTINDSSIFLNASGSSSMTFYEANIDLRIPSDFNPLGNSRVENPEVTPFVKLVDDSVANTPNQVNETYSSQLASPGANAETLAAASAMLTQIENDLALEGAAMRYPAEFYLAFREGLLSRVLISSDSTDGVIGQLTVPYVFFTNETDSSNTHHPFMVISSYGIPDGMALLWDVPRPPGDGETPGYESQSVTRSYHREAFLMKIPLRDYGEVETLTENTMVNDLASDVGETVFDHHNYASVSATGVAIDGVVIYPSYNNMLHVSQEAAELSAQGMHSGRGLGVHYHADAFSAARSGLNLYNAGDYIDRSHPPIVSMGFDGVAGYGIYLADDTDSDGVEIALDEFGGHEHGEYGYHYHSQSRDEVVTGGGPGSNEQTEYTVHMLPPKGAWAGRINDIPEFWQGTSPNYVGGRSVYLGTE